jgi:hypothetical protein
MMTKHDYLIQRSGRRVTAVWLVRDGDDGKPDPRRRIRLQQGTHVRLLTEAEAERARALPYTHVRRVPDTDARRAASSHVTPQPTAGDGPPRAEKRRASVAEAKPKRKKASPKS